MRTYAEYLGLDGQVYVDEYNSRFAQRGRARRVASIPRRRKVRRAESNLVVVALAGIVAVAVLVVVAFAFSDGDANPTTPNGVAPTTTGETPASRRASTLVLRAAKGDCWVAVHEDSTASRRRLLRDDLPGRDADVRARAAPVRRVPQPLRQGSHRRPERHAGHRLPRGQGRRRRDDPGRPHPGLTAPPRATVLLTGSELVRGSIDDANGAFLGRELTRLGLEPARWIVVGDRPEELEAALREALRRGSLRHLGRARPDARRPDDRAPRAA